MIPTSCCRSAGTNIGFEKKRVKGRERRQLHPIDTVTHTSAVDGTGAGLTAFRVIFFDAVGTLFHLPRGVGFHYATVARRHGIILDAKTVDSAFRSTWQAMPLRAATGVTRHDDDKGWWRQLVTQVVTRCGIELSGSAQSAFFEELYAEFARPGVWELFPEVPEVLGALHGKYTLGIISNFDGRLRAILSHLGLNGLFAHLIISSETGADKPSPLIFDRALREAGVSAREALHAGDDPERDWSAAHAAGLAVFRLDRRCNDLRDLLAKLGR